MTDSVHGGGVVWPREKPFEPGNELSMTHGAYSPRRTEPLATELVDHVLDLADADAGMGYLRAPVHRMALWAWARAEAQVQLLTEYLADQAGESGVGDLDDDGIRGAYLLLHRAETRATTGRTRLGLDPLSRARLGKDVAQGASANADVALRMKQLHDGEQAEARARAQLQAEGWLPPAGEQVPPRPGGGTDETPGQPGEQPATEAPGVPDDHQEQR